MEAAIFNTRTGMNPQAPETAEYFDRDQVAYVFEKVGASTLKTVTSYGVLGYEVGDLVELIGDQTRRSFGEWELIGIRRFSNGALEGTVPSRKLSHWVFK